MDKRYTLEEVAERLKVSSETLERWVVQDRFPCEMVDGAVLFKEEDINEWVMNHSDDARTRLTSANEAARVVPHRVGHSLFDLLLKGRIGYQLEGDVPAKVIANAVAAMPLPGYCQLQDVTTKIQEREGIISTAIGRGIAIPHARNPIMEDLNDERLGLFFLRQPVDFKALDREPVRVIFLMLSADRRSHLHMIQRIGAVCSRSDFHALLERTATREEILEFLNENRQILD